MSVHVSSPFDWESIKGYRVFSSAGEVLGIVTDIDYLSDARQAVILVNAFGTNMPRTLRIPSRMVGIIASKSIYLDATPRWAEDEDHAGVSRAGTHDPRGFA